MPPASPNAATGSRKTSTTSGPAPSNEEIEEMKVSVAEAIKEHETAELLTVVGDSNGWTLQQFAEKPHRFVECEMFLLNVPRLKVLRHFRCLTVVKLVHISLTSMADLAPLTRLEEIWLMDNELTTIEGLDNMRSLKKLVLTGNSIASMDDIPFLPNLTELWLARNVVTRVSHLDYMPKLRKLWLGGNPISDLGRSFAAPGACAELQELNLAGAKLYSFHHIGQVRPLKALRSLWFSDPLFGDNPVCRLNNYTTFTLHVVPSLEKLDHVVITQDQRALASSIYGKKFIYYENRIRVIERNHRLLAARARSAVDAKVRAAQAALDTLADLAAPIEGDIAERQAYGSRSSNFQPDTVFPSSALHDAQRHLQRAMGTRGVEAERLEHRYAQAVQHAAGLRDGLCERLCIELNTGGNIRLEELNPSDSWYDGARELLLSRFHKEEGFTKKFGISGVEVSKVHRIVNKGLRLCFDERVKELGIDLANPSCRRSLVCLFHAVPTTSHLQREVLQYVMIHGFSSSSARQAYFNQYFSDDENGIPMTNSLYYADEERLQMHLDAGELKGVGFRPGALSGQVIVSRVFLGKTAPSVSVAAAQTSSGAPVYLRTGRRVRRNEYSSDVFSVYEAPQSSASDVRLWHCFDHALVLPEFLIEYTYTSGSTTMEEAPQTLFHDPKLATLRKQTEEALPGLPKSEEEDVFNSGYPLLALLHSIGAQNALDAASTKETQEAINTAETLHAKLKGLERPNTAVMALVDKESGTLSASGLGGYAGLLGVKTDKLTYCMLINCHISSVKLESNVVALHALTTLQLSRNSIGEVVWADLAAVAPSLQVLDLGENNLQRIDFSKFKLRFLTVLSLQRNKLDTIEDFAGIAASLPQLKKLAVDGNPMMSTKAVRLLAFYTSGIETFERIDLCKVGGTALHSHTLVRHLRERTLDFAAPLPADGKKSLAAQYLIYTAARTWTDAATTVFSLAYDEVPDKIFEEVLQPVIRREPKDRAAFMQGALAHLSESTDPAGIPSSGNSDSKANAPMSLSFSYRDSLLHDLSFVNSLGALQTLRLRGHAIQDMACLTSLKSLRTLDLEDNFISRVPRLDRLRALRELNLNFNNITTLADAGEALPELRVLGLSGNTLTTVDVPFIVKADKLEALYIANNALPDVKVLYALRSSRCLTTLDIYGNAFEATASAEEREEFRYYTIFHLTSLRVLSGEPIGQAERQSAREVFAGKMSKDLLAERTGVAQKQWGQLKELDVSFCSLREVSMMDNFPNLEILKLQHNALLRVEGLRPLSRLRALHLSFNRLGNTTKGAVGQAFRPLVNLESLSLEANNIADLPALGLELPKLRFLNLKGNTLQFLDNGLAKLPDLRELIVDRNRLRALNGDCFASNRFLRILSADENAIRSTEALSRLAHLEQLSLGSNRLAELQQLLNEVGSCPLTSATFIGNPVARKTPYRRSIIAQFPHLTQLDGKAVTADERERLEAARSAELTAPPNVVIDLGMPGPPPGIIGGGPAGMGGGGGGVHPSNPGNGINHNTGNNNGAAGVRPGSIAVGPPQTQQRVGSLQPSSLHLQPMNLGGSVVSGKKYYAGFRGSSRTSRY